MDVIIKKTKDQEDFLNDSSKCPKCKSGNTMLLALGPYNEFVHWDVECGNCGLRFTEVYELTRYFIEGEEKSFD